MTANVNLAGHRRQGHEGSITTQAQFELCGFQPITAFLISPWFFACCVLSSRPHCMVFLVRASNVSASVVFRGLIITPKLTSTKLVPQMTESSTLARAPTSLLISAPKKIGEFRLIDLHVKIPLADGGEAGQIFLSHQRSTRVPVKSAKESHEN